MGYRNLRQCIDDLAASGQLVRIDEPIDPRLEMAEIQRRVQRAGGPAVYFANVRGCRFPMVGNLFGTKDRVRWLFRDALEGLARLVRLQVDPTDLLRRPRLYLDAPRRAWHSRPRKVRGGPVLANRTTIDQLPQLVSWPDDGGAYITLPQVFTEDPDRPGLNHSNLGMYRVQLSGGQYRPNEEVGLHYQIHRGIESHHAAAIRRGERLRVNVFVGGPPAMTIAAVMPLPEGMSELAFAGVLGRRRVPMICRDGELPIAAEADFCICGYLDPSHQLPEGPFGDHLGYYSLAHDFPVLRVERVYHRDGAIWPFTVVGRPPQEDTQFAELIHELTGPVIAKTIPGVHAVHAVDAAGVHPLLLALGSERYVPYEPRRPRELLTQANAILGQGQLSLAKYLWIAAADDDAAIDVRCIEAFLAHVLRRVDWRRDVHFQTQTTIDTLDYTGSGLNAGSKAIIAAAGPAIRELPSELPSNLSLSKEHGIADPHVAPPGVLVVAGPNYALQPEAVARWTASLDARDPINRFPLVVVVDDARFAARSLENLLWVTFTRSNPAADIHGVESCVEQKHWGCRGSLVIDARIKPHHAPPLVEDPEITRRVDRLAASGGPLHGLI
ncbi:MAG TPA: 3-octaprenyl-4-hydroxybenzoate carboxy-lyase [Planctomycetaceae bacterium]|nr:3-octaprenyl-4-hydroxybenzoate carboxy-lyase [Planctomycetaceae bacterium]